MAVEFRQTVLDNGLTVVGEVDDSAHTAAVGFFVKTGSRDEPCELMGVSHFLEHMMFKGTAKRSAADVNREFDEIGANYNASTSQETTCYYAHVLPQFLGRAIDLLGDMLRPALRTEDFEMEKKVILEEIGMYSDRPFWVVYEKAMEEYFGGHPLSYRVLGTNETVGGLTAERMRDYFERRYCPDNMVVSLAGKIDFDAAVERLRGVCGAWKRTGAKRDYRLAEPHAADRSVKREKVSMHYVVGVCPGPSQQDDERYAAAILSHALGDSDNSRLYWELVDPGLADEMDLSHHPYDKTGSFMFYASCPVKNAAKVEKILLHVLDTAAEGLNEDQVKRASSKIAMDLTLQNERPAGRMMALGGQWLYLGRRLPMEEVLTKLQAVTVEDLKALVKKYPFTPRTVVRMSQG